MMTDRVHTSRRKNCGFTLIEMVMVIIITGIIAAVVAVFIRSPVEGYMSSVRRAELTDAADVALRRFARDVRLALPNSLRVSDSWGTVDGCSNGVGVTCYIEFIMTRTGGRYRDPSDGSTGGVFLSFTSGGLTFDVLGTMPDIRNGDYIIVYNLGTGYDPGNAYAAGDPCTNCNRAKVNGTPTSKLVTLVSNPFAAQSPPLPSPSGRFQVVPGDVKAVMFSCPSALASAGPFYRYANYVDGFYPTMSGSRAALSGTPPLMAANAKCTVSYSSSTALGRNGLLSITLTLTDPTSNESVTLFREIHVDNSP